MKILAGRFRGRNLLPPRGRGTTRPMTGLAKKSLFDTLGSRLEDAVVADLYCGTGTLGLEALSRGASMCCFADRDRDALSRLGRNIETLGVAEGCIIWRGDVTIGLSAKLDHWGRALDVAFVDPPYAQSRGWSWPRAEKTLFAPLAEHLADEGLVVLRVDASATPPETLATLVAGRVKRYGDMVVAFYEPQRNPA